MSATEQGRWDVCLQNIRDRLPEQAFRTWFQPLRFVSLLNGKLTLCAPNKYVIEYIEDHYLEALQQALHTVFGEDIELLYTIEQAATQPAPEPQPTKPTPPPLDPQLSAIFTFETFVEGKANKLARAVALSITKQPGKQAFNPFFLYGPSGVGKTHLVNAIGMRLKENNPQMRVLFVPAHVFKTQYTDSVRHNTTNDFIHFDQTIDCLIIDDIQEITTAKTQEAFFHIFNHLQLLGKQIVLTCDKAPAQIEGMEDRMITRFRSGMVAEMEQPDIALRRAIMQAKIRRDGLKIPRQVVDYIAQNVDSSVRELQGIINTLMAYSVVDNCEITLEMTARIVARAVNLEKKELTPEDITRHVCRYFNVKLADLQSASRKQQVVQARQLAMYLTHKYTRLTYAEIGRVVARRDHSAVLHSCNQVSNRIAVDKEFRRIVEELEAGLKKK